MSTASLERELTELARHLDAPRPVAMGSAVVTRIAESPARRPNWTRRVIAAIVAALGVLGIAVAVSPAIADRLGLSGVTVELREPEVFPTELGANLDLGRRVTIDEARRLAGFDITLPDRREVGDPAEAYISSDQDAVVVSLLWPPGRGLPPAGRTDVGLLISELRGDGVGIFGKTVRSNDDLEFLSVSGNPAIWIEGPHEFSFQTARLAANVLLWEVGELTFRLESGLDRDAAVRLAESMR